MINRNQWLWLKPIKILNWLTALKKTWLSPLSTLIFFVSSLNCRSNCGIGDIKKNWLCICVFLHKTCCSRKKTEVEKRTIFFKVCTENVYSFGQQMNGRDAGVYKVTRWPWWCQRHPAAADSRLSVIVCHLVTNLSEHETSLVTVNSRHVISACLPASPGSSPIVAHACSPGAQKRRLGRVIHTCRFIWRQTQVSFFILW